MSTGYNIFPLSEIAANNDKLSDLHKLGLGVPELQHSYNRFNPNSLRSVITHMPGCDCKESANIRELEILITDLDSPNFTFLYLSDPERDHQGENTVQWLRFNNGSPEFLVKIVRYIAINFGPMLLTESSGEVVIVTPTTPDNATWKIIRP